MPRKLRRAVITLLWAGLLVAAGPAIGYAQGASDYLSAHAMASEQQVDVADHESAKADVSADIAEQAK